MLFLAVEAGGDKLVGDVSSDFHGVKRIVAVVPEAVTGTVKRWVEEL